MAYAIYIAVKLLSYSLWCWVGLRWIWGSPSFPRALGFGVLRLMIGIFFGVAIFFFFPASPNDRVEGYSTLATKHITTSANSLVYRRYPGFLCR